MQEKNKILHSLYTLLQSQKIYSSSITTMLQQLKDLIAIHISLSDQKGLFFSLFDQNGALLESQGALVTDKPLEELLDLFYQGIISKREKETKKVVLDIVQWVQSMTNVSDFLSLSPKIYGVVLTSTKEKKTGILLPDTVGIDTMQQALAAIKQKHQLSWDVQIEVFQTKRLIWNG